jgi:hypothetical protein
MENGRRDMDNYTDGTLRLWWFFPMCTQRRAGEAPTVDARRRLLASGQHRSSEPLPMTSSMATPPSSSQVGIVITHDSSSGLTFQSNLQASSIFGALSLFEGSPSYKQRRKPSAKKKLGAKERKADTPVSSINATSSTSPLPPETASASPSPSMTLPPNPQFQQLPYGVMPWQAPYPAAPPVDVVQYGMPPPVREQYAYPRLPTSYAGSLPCGEDGLIPPSAATPLLSASSGPAGQGGLKTYVCPLYSCGRLFKRWVIRFCPLF